MTELEQAIAEYESAKHYGEKARLVETLYSAARCVAMIEKLEKECGQICLVKEEQMQWMVSVPSDDGFDHIYANTLQLALEAALKKVGG